jgi:hypothetical protein
LTCNRQAKTVFGARLLLLHEGIPNSREGVLHKLYGSQ